MSQLKVHSPKKWQSNKKESYKKVNHSRLNASRQLKRKRGWRFWFKLLFIIGIITVFLGGIFTIGLFAYYSKDIPDPNKLIDRQISQATKIYDRTGEHLLYEIHGDENRTLVQYEDIPRYAIDAVVAIEDKDFWTKKYGLSFKRNVLAVLYYGLNKIPGVDLPSPGGSGLTQQFIKNSILTNERSVKRKMKEWILTFQVEQKYEKEEILQMYFNEIAYGQTMYGIESACRKFFGKSVSEISLAESALLAGLINRPTKYSPYGSHQDELFGRQAVVIGEMVKQGYITQEKADEALAEEVEFRPNIEEINAPHFVFYVKELLVEEYGYTEKSIEQDGLRIITTLDYDLQQQAEEILLNSKEHLANYGASNASLVAMDPVTGDILAMVGSVDYFDIENDGNVNVSIRPRQPGSSMKPIIYGTAFAKGYTPETVLYDVETVFKTEQGTDYIPHNYDLRERGLINMRKSLAGSLNITAVKTMYLSGISTVLDKFDELGYTTFADRSRFGLALVLGGGEVKLLEHVNAFTAFANEGLKPKKRAILEIRNYQGEVIQKFNEEQTRVWEEQTARQINDILTDTTARSFVFGANKYLMLNNQPVAVKTGTTNDYRDAWLVGYTPYLVTGVWVGNNDNSKMERGASGGRAAAPIWDEFMEKVVEDRERVEFTAPYYEKVTKNVLKGEVSEMQKVEIDKVSGKLVTDLTPENQREERYFVNPHSILHYLYVDYPRGKMPEEGKYDKAYKYWESGIIEWYKKEALQATENEEETEEATTELCLDGSNDKDCEKVTVYLKAPPTEFDDVHTIESLPSLTIFYPNDFANLVDNNQSFQVVAHASQDREIAKIEFYINDDLLGEVTEQPYRIDYNLLEYANGFYTLKAVVFDDIDNKAEQTVTIQINTTKPEISTTWMGPKNYDDISLSQFPLSLNLMTSHPDVVTSATFYYQQPGNSQRLIATVLSVESNMITIAWDDFILAGDYEIWAELNTVFNEKVYSDRINISIGN